YTVDTRECYYLSLQESAVTIKRREPFPGVFENLVEFLSLRVWPHPCDVVLKGRECCHGLVIYYYQRLSQGYRLKIDWGSVLCAEPPAIPRLPPPEPTPSPPPPPPPPPPPGAMTP